jgi:hypothetical protein
VEEEVERFPVTGLPVARKYKYKVAELAPLCGVTGFRLQGLTTIANALTWNLFLLQKRQ